MNRKNNFGFTLIELLSVIALLAALALIVIPNIDKILRNSKTDLYEKQVDLIETAAKLWATNEDNAVILSNNTNWPYVITLGQLQIDSYIDSNIKNPITNEYFSENMLIYIDQQDQKYSYYVDEESNDVLAPVLTINGESIIESEIGSVYSDSGASAVDPSGNVLSVSVVIRKDGETVYEINENAVGTYIINYYATYTDESDVIHNGYAARIVRFVDTTAPVITCASCTDPILIESINNYDLPSVTVTDNSGEIIPALIVGKFSSKIPGEKTVVYQATDSSGNVGTYSLNLLVKDSVAPIFTYTKNITQDYVYYELFASDEGSGVKDYSFDGGVTWTKENSRNLQCDATVTLAVEDYAGNISYKEVTTTCLDVWNYSYTGDYQTFTALYTGWYKIELWGASGGRGRISNVATINLNSGGKGSYTNGEIYLTEGEVLYLYLGGVGGDNDGTASYTYGLGGYNGGGNGGYENQSETYPENGAGGGGATDVRLVSGTWNDNLSLASRIMVAAGGGGGGSTNGAEGSDGATLIGLAKSSLTAAGTQISGYAFGIGRNGYISSSNYGAYGGGGGGYYGGTWTSNNTTSTSAQPGASGSSFISGYAGVNAITSITSTSATANTIHYSGKYFVNGRMDSEVNSGNGKAKITFITDDDLERTNNVLNNVRYIKNCINGSSANTSDHWVELQAIKNGINLALNKTVTGTVSQNSSYPYSRIVDGDITTSNYALPSSYGLQCITVDLGETYNLDEIALWHYYNDSRTYYSNTTYVSNDGTYWVVAMNSAEAETANGQRVSAYYDQEITNPNLNNVRYLKDCINGSSSNTYNPWVELQAVTNGVNVALNKNVTGTSAIDSVGAGTYMALTDGNIDTAVYARSVDFGLQCITVDLGNTYDLDKVSVWHYYSDSRTFYFNTTYASSDGLNWTEIMSKTEASSKNGKTVLSSDANKFGNTTMSNVMYVKDCINGSSVNTGNHWVEIEALANQVDVALNKTVTGTVAENASYPYSRVTDRSIVSSNYSASSVAGLQCVTVNLGNYYDLDQINVWHYYTDSRIYNENTLYVSYDGNNWSAVNNRVSTETINGKTVKAYGN